MNRVGIFYDFHGSVLLILKKQLLIFPIMREFLKKKWLFSQQIYKAWISDYLLTLSTKYLFFTVPTGLEQQLCLPRNLRLSHFVPLHMLWMVFGSILCSIPAVRQSLLAIVGWNCHLGVGWCYSFLSMP